MTARTVDSAFHLPSFPSSAAKCKRPNLPDPVLADPAATDLHAPVREEPLGVFRGLAFAILFQFIVGILGYAGWELFRHLR